MLKELVLPGTMLLVSAGVSHGLPEAPSPADQTFALTVPPAPAVESHGTATHEQRVFTRDDDGLFYVDALVNGTSIRFVVDTGSNVVVLTGRDAARIGMAPGTMRKGAMQTVGGMASMRSGTVDRLEIAGQSLEHVDAATVDHGLNVSLLGQSALSRLRSIRLSGDRLELN